MGGFLLETARLRLRPFGPDDVDDLFEVLGDSETMRYYPQPYSRDGTLGGGSPPKRQRRGRDHCFGALGLERVISLIRPQNLPSRRVAEKIGMIIEREVDYHGYRHLVCAAWRLAG